jgi:hypothetical protein
VAKIAEKNRNQLSSRRESQHMTDLGRTLVALGPEREGQPAHAVTIELQEAAQVYTSAALETLHRICINGESEAARVSAACALLDRAHGKPKQQQEVKLDSSDAFLKLWIAISDCTS